MNPKTTNRNELPSPSNRERFWTAINWKWIEATWERAHPWAIGIVAGAMTLRVPIDAALFEKILKEVAPSVISVAAIFAGFQGAIHAILLTMLRSTAVRTIRRLKLFDRLIGFIRSGILSMVLHVSASLLVLFVYWLGKCPPTWMKGITAGLTGLFAFSLMASLRIIMLEVKILASPDEEEPAPT